jgi:hypothetical protein
MDAILADIQGGQGTAGLLLRDRSLFDEVQKVVARLPFLYYITLISKMQVTY